MNVIITFLDVVCNCWLLLIFFCIFLLAGFFVFRCLFCFMMSSTQENRCYLQQGGGRYQLFEDTENNNCTMKKNEEQERRNI